MMTHFRHALFGILVLNLLPGATWADTLILNNGDTLNGEILQQDETSIQFLHPTLGTLTIARSDLKPEPEPAPESAPDDNGLLETGLLTGWKRNLAFGLNGAEGNSNNSNLHLDLNFAFENPGLRKKFALDYDLKHEDGEETENDLVAQMDNDYLMPDSRWFWFHRERFDWDKFEDWDYRFGGYIGPGYDFINTDTLHTSGRLGIGGTQTWGGDDEGFGPELLIGLDANWKISEIQTLALSNTLYPSLDEGGEYRNISRLDWKLKLSDMYKGIALKLGIINEYESMTADDSRHNDLKYNVSLDIGL